MTLLSCEFRADLFGDASDLVDKVSPVVVSHNLPLNNSSPNDFHIWLRFSEKLDADSVNTDSVVLRDNSNNAVTNISITYNPAYNEINITGVTDSNYLIRGSVYSLTVTTKVSDIAGNNLNEEFSGNLTVAASPQVPGNTSIWTNNYNSGYFVEDGDNIYIEFNENIATSLSSAAILSKTTFTPSPSFSGITVTISGNQLIYTVGDVGTNADTYCTINLSAGDFSSSADGTACQAQTVVFTVMLKAVKN